MRLRLRLVSVVLLLVLVTGFAVGSDPMPATGARSSSDPVLLFVSDGMRHDVMKRLATEGQMPTYRRVLRGVEGENGMIPGVVTNSAPGWVTLATGTTEAVHGITNNTFHDNTMPFQPFGVSGFTAGTNQAETIAERAQAEGLTVAALGWVAFDPGSIVTDMTAGAVIDFFPDWLTGRGIIANFEVGLEWTHLLPPLGPPFLTSTQVELEDASDWEDVPASFSTPRETTFEVGPLTFHVYIYDSTDDGATNFDQVLVSPTKDGSAAVAELTDREWSDSIQVEVPGTLIGVDEVLQGGFYVKVHDLEPDLSRFRLYFSQVTRVRAWPPSLADELVAQFDAVPATDFTPYIMGLIDAETHVEQTLLADTVRGEMVYPYVIERLKPDLALVGLQGTDAIQHRFQGLADPGTDAFDPENAATYQGFIDDAYITADRALQATWRRMANANVIVGSDHGFESTSAAINANFVLELAGLHDPVNLAGSQAVAYAAGGTAQVYINLEGRNPDGIVPEHQYETVQQQIVDAFSELADDGIVERVLRRDETDAVLTAMDVKLSMLHPDRTGDVVIFSAPPFQFDAATQGEVTAPAPILGQHGFVPDGSPQRMGAFAATGPRLVNNQMIGPVTAPDVAPTIAAILGIDPPADATGTVLDILRPRGPR